MSAMQSPVNDDRIYALRSIANSIEVVFPEAAGDLRAIALSLTPA